MELESDRQIRKFQCNQCKKFKFVLKKMADQQHHGFACDECWTTINKQSRYSYGRCQIS